MKASTTTSVTINNVTPEQFEAITQLLNVEQPTKRTRKSKPHTTVNEDEDEEFGTSAMSEDDLDETTSEEDEEAERVAKSRTVRNSKRNAGAASEDDDSETDDTEGDEEESSVSFEDVKAAVNKYGEKNPEGMRAILLTFNLKGPKELKLHPKYWEPVYTKVLAKLKALKHNKRK